MTEPNGSSASRREFLKASTAAAVAGGVAAQLGVVPSVHAAGGDTLRVGVVGCGGRGRGAADNCVSSAENVKIVALADAFPDRLDDAKKILAKLGKDKVDVPDDQCFVGLDAYKKLVECDLDLVILATPPGFRPDHIEAVIGANKHLFTEKPVGVDGPGIRKVLGLAEEAKKKKLAVVAGTQRRHQKAYLESMERIHGGDLGEIVTARCYWNQGGLWMKPRESSWSDVEWQLRNWLYFTWLSGDHICEQHVHNIDVINWAMKGHPISASGMGGREVRTDPAYGNIFDHFAVEFEYPDDVHVLSECRQIEGCEKSVSEAVVGTKGRWSGSGTSNTHKIEGEKAWRYRSRDDVNPYVQEHTDLIASIRDGKPLNELRTVAESTLTAIMGRMSTYTGKKVTWEQALGSKLVLKPEDLRLDMALATPPVAVPGLTELI